MARGMGLLVLAACGADDTTTVVRVSSEQLSVMHVMTGCACADIPLGSCESYGDTTPACRCEGSVSYVIEGVGSETGFAFGNFAGSTVDVDGGRISIPAAFPSAPVVDFDPAGNLTWMVETPIDVFASNGGTLVGVTCHEPAGVTTAPIHMLDEGTPSVMAESRTRIDGIDVRMRTPANAP